MSIGVAANALRPALYARLNGDATLIALAPIYDEPPEGAAFPYVIVGDVEEMPNNRMGGKVGRELVATVHAWTEDRGMKTAQAILARVDLLLDNYLALSCAGYTTERCDLDGSNYERVDVAGSPLRHGSSRYRINLVET